MEVHPLPVLFHDRTGRVAAGFGSPGRFRDASKSIRRGVAGKGKRTTGAPGTAWGVLTSSPQRKLVWGAMKKLPPMA
ncbi:MAG: hypothetical protein Q9225_005403 [Loekoesia sp. 1 TL-2023]